jgi:hypothetical protein
MKEKIKRFLDKLPYVRGLKRRIGVLENQLEIYETRIPPGHYYSPCVSVDKVKEKEDKIFAIGPKTLPHLDLNEDAQLELVSKLALMYGSMPFPEQQSEGLRYYLDNGWYFYSDAIFLHLLLRYYKPRSVIEIGSGFSSALMMDTNELFMDKNIDLTFIEPNPERLYSLFRNEDKQNYKTITSELQDVDLELFDRLQENDILFIDSTHVSKVGSDVNLILFEILPRLKKGVLIHFHDIFYPFEYPKRWVYEWKGFGWNETYTLRAFLMHNDEYKIILFNSFLEHFHPDWFQANMPLCLKNGGGSLWLQKQ